MSNFEILATLLNQTEACTRETSINLQRRLYSLDSFERGRASVASKHHVLLFTMHSLMQRQGWTIAQDQTERLMRSAGLL